MSPEEALARIQGEYERAAARFAPFNTLFSPLGFGYGVQFLGYAWAGYALWSQAASQHASMMVPASNT